MNVHFARLFTLAPALYIFFAVTGSNDAYAVPSYARQMNIECGGCHTSYPKLNAFGRQFKLSGYTLAAAEQIEAEDQHQRTTLGFDQIPPMSVMLQTAYTQVDKTVPDSQNNTMQFPQQLSLFLAGRITPKIGSFVQLTYSQADDKFGMDNAEFRFADSTTIGGNAVTYGITLNNNPTVEDLWNSTPAWGFPFSAPDTAPSPGASTLIDGGLGQDVAGVGAYVLLNQTYYFATTLYRSAHLGSLAPDSSSSNTVDGVAPYFRFAWQHQWGSNYLSLGGYGLWTELVPTGVSGSTDKYRDIAADFQFEKMLRGAPLTVHGTYIRERQDLDATFASGGAANSSNDLKTLRLDGSYGIGQWELAGGYFSTTGDGDAGLYAPAEIDGSRTGSPDSRGWVLQAAYFPWQNVQLTMQYIGYTRFNGSRADYDGFGRNASDNNTLFVQAWFVW